VKFVVEDDGTISDVEVMKGIGFGCDEEAIRVVKSMPKWNPGVQNGKNVRVYYNMPIVYKLD
jgi:protein TonB